MEFIERTYAPKGYSVSATVKLTKEQANILDKMAEKSEFNALFWAVKVEWLNNGDINSNGEKVVRINGEHYVIGSENAPGSFRGFGGRKFVIKFIDGNHKDKIVTTTNLWCQGDIPEELRHILKDNAIFLKDDDITNM
jgi:hypothetical protein